MNVLLVTIPAVVVFLTAYLLLDRLLKNEDRRRASELQKQDRAAVVPVRLRAYERLALFLERTQPAALMVEAVQPGMTCLQLQARLLETIRHEYAHNVSQQVYVSDELWEAVVSAKESLMGLVNTCAASCDPKAGAQVLAERIVQTYSSVSDTPSEVALSLLKKEVSKNFW